jgi:hypothetical protein
MPLSTRQDRLVQRSIEQWERERKAAQRAEIVPPLPVPERAYETKRWTFIHHTLGSTEFHDGLAVAIVIACALNEIISHFWEVNVVKATLGPLGSNILFAAGLLSCIYLAGVWRRYRKPHLHIGEREVREVKRE